MPTFAISDAVRRLAMHVSIAARIEPGLLRAMRLRLLPHFDVSAESDLWFSDLVEARSTLRIVLRHEVATALRAELASSRSTLEAAHDVVVSVHRHAPPALQLEEEITYLALCNDEQASTVINERLLSVLHAISAGGRPGLVDWAARALPRMPHRVRDTPVGAALGLLTGGAGDRNSVNIRRAFSDDEGVAALLSTALPVAPVHIRLIDVGGGQTAVEASRENLEAAHVIEVPRTEPLLVELTTSKEVEVLEVPAEGSVTHPVEGSISIRSLSGAVYELVDDEVAKWVPAVGQMIHGTVVAISGDDAFVSYGGPSEAVLAVRELEGVDVGDSVEGEVVSTTPDIRISRELARNKASVEKLRQIYQNHLAVEGKVTGRNKGGFEVSVAGLRAFCPLSQIALGKIENPDTFVNQTYEFRVTELSDDGRRIVVSRAALLKEAAQVRAAEARERVVPGAELVGRVKTLVPFGAFVDLGGVDGLLHVSEMSRRRVTDPKEVVQVGQEVRVRVIKVENDGKRISLSMKEFEKDPWRDVEERYAPGTQFSGRIVRSTDFGFFVEVEPGLDGLVHVSQLPLGVKANDMKIGQNVTGWVRQVDPSKKRLSLSLREIATSDPWEDATKKYPIGRVLEGTIDHVAAPGVFVQIEPGLVGLVPRSEIDQSVAESARPGEKLVVRVMSVDASRRRISLSYDAAKAAAEREEYSKFMDEQRENEGESAMAKAFRRALRRKSE